MSSTLPVVAIGLGLVYYTMQGGKEGKAKVDKMREEQIKQRVAINEVEEERKTKRDADVVKLIDAPANNNDYPSFITNLFDKAQKMIVDSGLPFSFDTSSKIVGSGGAKQIQKSAEALPSKILPAKNELDDGTQSSMDWWRETMGLKKTDNTVSVKPNNLITK